MTGKLISQLTHDTSLDGTEKVPLSPDGYATAQEIANLGLPRAGAHLDATALGTLHSAPTQIVAAPSAGELILPVLTVAEYVPGAHSQYYPGIRNAEYYWTSPTGPLFSSFSAFALPTSPDEPSHFTYVGAGFGTATGAKDGSAGRALYVGADNDPTLAGPIVSASLNFGGSGYAPGDTGTMEAHGWSAQPPAYVVDTVDGGGAVLTFTITDAGNGNLAGDTVGTSPTSGSGNGNFIVNIDSIDPIASGDLYVQVFYTIVTVH